MTTKTWIVPLTDTTLDEAEEAAALRVIRSGWLTMGAEVAAFEEEFAAALQARHAVAVANGTVALQLAYEALGLGPGDEFCIPALTFVATMHAGMCLGGKPVLIDCASEDDLTLCPVDLERKLTERTRLIVTVPYGGFAPDMDRICALASARGVPVAEDACHAPLATLDGRKIGTFGDASTWSFYGNKNLTTGEGGMVVADDDEVVSKLRLMRSHGMTSLTWERHQAEKAGLYDVRLVGYNFRLDEIRAAIGREQLRKLPAATERRREAANEMLEALEPLRSRGLGIPFRQPRGVSAHHLFVVLLPAGCDRAAFRQFLNDEGVQTSVHYPPIHRFPHVVERLGDSPLPVFNAIGPRLLTLPMGPSLTGDQIRHVANSVEAGLDRLCS